MILPTVHINGTSRDALTEANEVAARALDHALECLEDARPNGRDFYPQGVEAMRQAIAEHADRVAALRRVRADLGAILDHLCE